ncbi:MAG: hypothetical protein JNM69_39910 [Archangium sp.]|nr:hypothetical protein [Archangium sp.]
MEVAARGSANALARDLEVRARVVPVVVLRVGVTIAHRAEAATNGPIVEAVMIVMSGEAATIAGPRREMPARRVVSIVTSPGRASSEPLQSGLLPTSATRTTARARTETIGSSTA